MYLSGAPNDWPILESTVRTDTAEFKANYTEVGQLVRDLKSRIESVVCTPSSVARDRHVGRKKMLTRDRVDALLDTGTPFVELSQLAGHELYENESIPSAAIVTGIGSVAGRLCMIVANDALVKGGTYYPITVKKHLRAQEIARENRLPCIYLVDSGGMFCMLLGKCYPIMTIIPHPLRSLPSPPV